MSEYLVWDNQTATVAPNEATLKEQVQDLVVNLFPLDTPLHQVTGTIDMSNRISIDTPIDTYSSELISRTSAVFSTGGASFAGINAKPENHTYATGTPRYMAKLRSVAEIQGRQFGVSDTSRALSYWGMVDRFALEALKTTQGLVNQFEHSFWWSPGTPEQGAQLHTGGGVDVARQTQGIVHWVCKSGLQRSKIGLGIASFQDGHGNEFGTNSPALNTGASSWAYDAAGAPLDQAMFRDNLLSQWYSITGRQSGAVGFCGARIKGMFSQFALTANGPVNDRTLEAAAKRVIDVVDVYETEFGPVSMNLCRYLNISGQSMTITQSPGSTVVPFDEVLVLMQPKYWKRGIVRPIYMSPIGKTRDGEDGLVRGEQAMVCLNPQAGAAIVNCVS